jgi:hypothetical protein
MPVAAWWCLVAVGVAACGVTLGDFPLTAGAALLFVVLTLMPAAVLLMLWPAAIVTPVIARGRAVRRRTPS